MRIKKHNFHMATASLIGVSLVLSAGCAPKKDAAKEKAGQAQAANQPSPVQVETAKSETVLRIVPVTGSLIALQTVELLPKLTARVVSLSGREGDSVRAGQVVAQLDTADLERQVEQARSNVETARTRLSQAQTNYETQLTTSDVAIQDAQEALRGTQAQLALTRRPQRSQEVIVAENNVKQAQANFDKAKSDRTRYEALFKEGATAAITLDQYVTQEKVAQANLNSAKQQFAIAREGGRAENIASQEAQVARSRQALRQAQANRANVSVRGDDIESARSTLTQSQAALGVAQQAVRDASLRSPINGVIADRKIEPGQLAAPGTSVAQIVALETVYFEAQINEQDVSRVRQGQTVQVKLDAYPNRVFAGKVAKVFPTASVTGRTFFAAVQIPNSGGVLRPGLFARGEIVTERRPNSVTAPIEAIIRDPESENKARVFTVDNGVAQEQNVTLGITSPDGRRVELQGVEPGSQIVVTGQRALKDGDRVTAEESGRKPATSTPRSGSGQPGGEGGSDAAGNAASANGGPTGAGGVSAP
ncbi:MAG: efflux RND transporter periplasmic adaptor subunit [Akkermansiaceae bacterium]|nr:efflux RND transporter periplasmic adaptor subunit [Armatimonadota bacterium]